MPCPRPLSFAASCLMAALCAGLAVCTSAARASDVHAPEAPASEAPILKKPAAQAAASSGKVEPAAEEKPPLRAAKAAAVDPLDRVRERLAEKLGARKAPEAGSPNVLRVAAHASATPEPHVVASGHAAPARASAMAAAARHVPGAAVGEPAE